MPETLFKVDLTKSMDQQEMPGHNRWHPDIPAVASVNPGDVFRIECKDWTDGQIKDNDDPKDIAACDALYRWFLPLLRLDTVPDFVQLIKLVMAETQTGDERVRAPRQPVDGADRARALEIIRKALAHRV